MKKIFLLFILAVGVSVGYAQTEETEDDRDYLIKTNGDTITGVFKYMTGEGDIRNKVTCKVNDTLKLTIKAQDIKYFKEGKNEYISFQPPGEEGHFLLKIILIGDYLSLYEWQLPLELGNGSKIEYINYVKKKGEDYFELYHQDWKKTLPDVIADYESLAEDVWRGKYKIEQLSDIVRQYNEYREDNK